MSLKEIIEKCKSLKICDSRCADDAYTEIVILNEQIDRWNQVFVEIFGPALKPAGVKPDKDVLCLTKEYGGIYDNQTLFKKEIEGNTVLAMFWPWGDKIHTTLKMAVLNSLNDARK